MSEIGQVVPEIWARKWSKSGQIEVPERLFEKISRNMTNTEKIMMTNIIGHFVADNIVFRTEVVAHHTDFFDSLNDMLTHRVYGFNECGIVSVGAEYMTLFVVEM